MAAAMSHDEVADLLALDAVGALDPSERDAMERHLVTCSACRKSAADYANVASLLPGALEVVPPPARLRRSLMAQVYAEASAPPSVPWWRRVVAAIPASRALTVVGAAAVVAAIVFGIWGASGRMGSQIPISVSYAVSGTTATGALAVGGGETPAVLTVDGLAAASQHQGLRGLAHPAARLTERGGVSQPQPAWRRLDGGRPGEPGWIQEHRRDRGAGRRQPDPLEHRGLERSAHRVLRRRLRSLAPFLRNRREDALDAGVVDHHASLPLAIALADALPLGVGHLRLGVHGEDQPLSVAGWWRRPLAIATLTAVAAASVT